MEKQNRSAIVSWLFPLFFLLVVVFIMLFNFSTKSKADAEETISKNLIRSTQDYGDDLLYKLETLGKIAGPVRVLLERDPDMGDVYGTQIADILYSCSDAYKVVYCDSEGHGVDNLGAEVSLAGEPYFENIAQFDSTSYVYVENDTAADSTEKSAIVVAERVSGEGKKNFLLMYYPLDKFEGAMSKADFDYASFLALIDSEGHIMGKAGAVNSSLLQGDNLLETIEPGNAEAARLIESRLNNGSRGFTSVSVGGEDCVLVYVPLGVNRWMTVLGVSQDYVDRQISLHWKNGRQMMIYLVIAVFVFIFLVIIINIIGKIRNNAKKKELEDKADTDLLTGLTNKLATERKIKDYMMKNPNSQSMLFILDVDNFKKINDTMGHAFGDEVLRSLGQQITSIFRASDIIGRVGGDEFMIFLKGIPDENTVRKEASKVENFFRNFQAGEYVKYAATASIGVAIYPQEGNDFESLYKAADQGLYKAKKRGKNQLAFYRDEWAQSKSEQQE